MKNIIYIILAIVSFISSCQKPTNKSNSISKEVKKPNVLILLADDLGYGELGCYGQEEIKTPNIDKIAKEGMKFTQFYAGSAVCAPSRAVLMTGINVGNLSIRGNYGRTNTGEWGRVALEKDEITLGEMMEDAGYQTAFIGKWHLGVPQDTSTWASGRGFQYAIQEQWGYSADSIKFNSDDHWVNGVDSLIKYDYTQWDCKDEFRTQLALDYLDKKRNKDKPLFMIMSYRTPHAHEFDLREKDRYKEKGWPEEERRHASRITMLDEQIQRLLDRLEATGELENTLVLITSDNGPQAENHNEKFFKSSGTLKGRKRDMYEGGIRVPMIAYWKGKIKEGAISNHPGIFYDIMPTLAEITGVNAPQQTDGISFLPELLGKEQKLHEQLYWEIQVGREPKGFKQAVRVGDWKVLRNGFDGALEFYDVVNNSSELHQQTPKDSTLLDQLNTLIQTESKVNQHWPFAGTR